MDAQEKPPSLGEIAKKELERRKGVKVHSKVFTDKDVRALRPKRIAAEPPAAVVPPAAPQAAVVEPKTPAEPEETKDEAWWRARAAHVRAAIRRDEIFAEELQRRINALAADFANRDDPFQRLRIADDRQKAIVELERVQEDLGLSRKQLADIEEEARRTGIPPGWIR